MLVPAATMAQPAVPAQHPAVGGLAIWLRAGPDGAISGTVGAAMGGTGAKGWRSVGEPVTLVPRPQAVAGDPMWSWQAREQAFIAARATLSAMAARSWGVPADACCCEGGRIRHPVSGREIGYRIWATFG